MTQQTDNSSSISPAEGELTPIAQLALSQATQGMLSIMDLLNAAHNLTESGQPSIAIRLYRTWLDHTESPLAYMVQFNLGVLLGEQDNNAGAEAAYNAALTQQPKFGQAYINLGLLLERFGRREEALACWTVMLGSVDLNIEKVLYLHALNNLGRLLEILQRLPQAEAMFARSLRQEPAQPDVLAHTLRLRQTLDALTNAALPEAKRRSCDPGNFLQPLVSILIPTHNRPHYAELALQSALAQTYANVEIVISDNSDDDVTRERFVSYVMAHPCIRYLRVPNSPSSENFLNCYNHAQGEYINFLMDDDLFHPEKIEKMMACMLGQPNIGLVTSFRLLIDENGDELPPSLSTRRLLEQASAVNGAALGLHMLTTKLNVVGELTTALFRKSDLSERFGMFHGKQYVVISYMVTWLSILSRKDCVYLPEALSYFRVHGGQDQRITAVQIKGCIEELEMFCDAYQHNNHLFASKPDIHSLLLSNLTTFIMRMAMWQEEIKRGGHDLERIHALIRQASTLLLTK